MPCLIFNAVVVWQWHCAVKDCDLVNKRQGRIGLGIDIPMSNKQVECIKTRGCRTDDDSVAERL